MANRSILGVCLMVAVVGSARAQELVTNGGFELPVISEPWVKREAGTSFGGWRVDVDCNGIAQVGSFGRPLAQEGAQSVELNFLARGGISQTLATVPGQFYRLTFLMAGQTDAGPNEKPMRIDWGGVAQQTVTWNRSAAQSKWVPHSVLLRASAASTVLHFLGLPDVDGGPYLDAVSVVPTCPADFNGDQFLDFTDFDAFVETLQAGGEAADYNGDGFLTFEDFDVFVETFEAGCG